MVVADDASCYVRQVSVQDVWRVVCATKAPADRAEEAVPDKALRLLRTHGAVVLVEDAGEGTVAARAAEQFQSLQGMCRAADAERLSAQKKVKLNKVLAAAALDMVSKFDDVRRGVVAAAGDAVDDDVLFTGEELRGWTVSCCIAGLLVQVRD